MKEKLAIFDIDGTIFRSSMIIELVNMLIKKGIFSKKAHKEIENDYLAWVDRKGSYDNYINKVVDVFKRYIRGASEAEVRQATIELMDEQKDRLYVFTRELVKKLKKQNYFLYAISGSPQVLVAEFALVLGFDDFCGNVYEIVGGKYTGRLPFDMFPHKSKILKDFIRSHKEFSFEKTLGVGDSEGDIPFLELVKTPIAFNPAKGLAEYAKKKKWRIVVERKNVVYDIKEFDFEFTN